jgi:hypothetical protein
MRYSGGEVILSIRRTRHNTNPFAVVVVVVVVVVIVVVVVVVS